MSVLTPAGGARPSLPAVARRARAFLAASGLALAPLLWCTTAMAAPHVRPPAAPPHSPRAGVRPAGALLDADDGQVLTASELAADLVAGAAIKIAPTRLDPPLAVASSSQPVINFDGCHLHSAGTRSKPCVFGDVRSKTTVVMFGDSHMAQWFPALEIISKQLGWRLLDFTKDGCTPAEVVVVRAHGTSPYPQCTIWRRNSLAQIAAIHPAMVLVQWARFLSYEARPLRGVPIGYGSIWQDGVAAVFKALRADSKLVVFIEDTPVLQQVAPGCIAAHRRDVIACTSPRPVALRDPVVQRQEQLLATEEGISVLNPMSWFCSPTTCPVIVGDIILYRDNAHMVPAYARFIEPVLEDALVGLGAPTGG